MPGRNLLAGKSRRFNFLRGRWGSLYRGSIGASRYRDELGRNLHDNITDSDSVLTRRSSHARVDAIIRDRLAPASPKNRAPDRRTKRPLAGALR